LLKSSRGVLLALDPLVYLLAVSWDVLRGRNPYPDLVALIGYRRHCDAIDARCPKGTPQGHALAIFDK
jgi:hypothetical protein